MCSCALRFRDSAYLLYAWLQYCDDGDNDRHDDGGWDDNDDDDDDDTTITRTFEVQAKQLSLSSTKASYYHSFNPTLLHPSHETLKPKYEILV